MATQGNNAGQAGHPSLPWNIWNTLLLLAVLFWCFMFPINLPSYFYGRFRPTEGPLPARLFIFSCAALPVMAVVAMVCLVLVVRRWPRYSVCKRTLLLSPALMQVGWIMPILLHLPCLGMPAAQTFTYGLRAYFREAPVVADIQSFLVELDPNLCDGVDLWRHSAYAHPTSEVQYITWPPSLLDMVPDCITPSLDPRGAPKLKVTWFRGWEGYYGINIANLELPPPWNEQREEPDLALSRPSSEAYFRYWLPVREGLQVWYRVE